MELLLKGVKWTNELCLTHNLPETVKITVDEECLESAINNGYLLSFLKQEVSESFVFTPIKIATYRILKGIYNG